MTRTQAPELIEAPAEAAHQDDVVERAAQAEVVGDAAVQEVNVAARALEVAVDDLSVPKAARVRRVWPRCRDIAPVGPRCCVRSSN